MIKIKGLTAITRTTFSFGRTKYIQGKRLLTKIDSKHLAVVAAFFSAAAAFFSYQTHKQNLLNSVRPELVLSDWTYSGNSSTGQIRINSIENIGVASALNVWADLKVTGDTCSELDNPSIFNERIFLIKSGERQAIDYEGRFSWKCGTQVGPDPLSRIIGLDLLLTYSDINDNIRETLYELTAYDLVHIQAIPEGGNSLARGLQLDRRYSQVKREKSFFSFLNH